MSALNSTEVFLLNLCLTVSVITCTPDMKMKSFNNFPPNDSIKCPLDYMSCDHWLGTCDKTWYNSRAREKRKWKVWLESSDSLFLWQKNNRESGGNVSCKSERAHSLGQYEANGIWQLLLQHSNWNNWRNKNEKPAGRLLKNKQPLGILCWYLYFWEGCNTVMVELEMPDHTLN